MKDQRRAFVFVEFDSEETVKKVIDVSSHKLSGNDVSISSFLW